MLSSAETSETLLLPTALEAEYWTQAEDSFSIGDYELAAVHYRKLGLRSKPLYNISICYFCLGDPDSAIVTLERAIRCDPYFAIAHYQLALCYQGRGESENAIAHYNDAVLSLRGNNFIDYQQLGLYQTVYACELYYNMASAQLQLSDRGAAMRSLLNASQSRVLVKHDIISESLLAVAEDGMKLFEPSKNEIFKNNCQKNSISNLFTQASHCQYYSEGRDMVNVAYGEADKKKTFIAPNQNEAISAQVERFQNVLVGKKHTRSSSMGYSFHSTSTSIDINRRPSLVKVHYVLNQEIAQTRIMVLDDCPTFDLLHQKLCIKFNQKNLVITYRDSDGDMITICDDSDLIAAFRETQSNNNASNVRLLLWCHSVPCSF